jgi:hypothetical protein
MPNKYSQVVGIKQNSGEYEYDISLPAGKETVSQQSSVAGHLSSLSPEEKFGHYQDAGNINVKKSFMKMGLNDIRDRDMDMSPKSSDLNFQNQNKQWKN